MAIGLVDALDDNLTRDTDALQRNLVAIRISNLTSSADDGSRVDFLAIQSLKRDSTIGTRELLGNGLGS